MPSFISLPNLRGQKGPHWRNAQGVAKVYSGHDENAKTLNEKAKDMHHLHNSQVGIYCIPESSRCLLSLRPLD